MPQQTEFYVVKINESVRAVYHALADGEKDRGESYDYVGFSLEEVALLSRTSPLALKECLRRVRPLLLRAMRSYMKKVACSEIEILPCLEEAVVKAIDKFDPSRGCFTHYLSRFLTLTIRSFNKSLLMRRKRVVNAFDEMVFEHSRDAREDGTDQNIRFRMDLDFYMALLTSDERLILRLFQEKHTFRDIAKAIHLSPTAVADKIDIMLGELKNRHRRLQI